MRQRRRRQHHEGRQVVGPTIGPPEAAQPLPEQRETEGVLASIRAAYDAGLSIARLQSAVAPFGGTVRSAALAGLAVSTAALDDGEGGPG